MDEAAIASMKKVFGEPGTPVVAVDVADLKAVFELGRDVQRRHEGRRVGIGFSILEKTCSAGAEVKAVAYRANMLALMVTLDQEQLADFLRDGQPADSLFKAVAQVPMEWIAVGVERQGLPLDHEEFMRLLHADTDSVQPRF